jgi:rhomboid family GlyGly-CTERM serine protease
MKTIVERRLLLELLSLPDARTPLPHELPCSRRREEADFAKGHSVRLLTSAATVQGLNARIFNLENYLPARREEGRGEGPSLQTTIQYRSFFHRHIGDRPELIFFTFLILIFSGPTIFGVVWKGMTLHPAAVQTGQWWRLFTHPFVHVTWYHLLLDAAAFLMLYHGLIEPSRAKRLSYVAAGWAGSLMMAWFAAPMIFSTGLCGLSGIAHGLMAISAAEMMFGRSRNSLEWKIGAITLAIVVTKAAYEAIAGKILFAFLYLGLVGNPVTVSHAGGIIGGLLVWLVCHSTAGWRA